MLDAAALAVLPGAEVGDWPGQPAAVLQTAADCSTSQPGQRAEGMLPAQPELPNAVRANLGKQGRLGLLGSLLAPSMTLR